MGTGTVTKQISPETGNWIFQVKNFPHQPHAKLTQDYRASTIAYKGKSTKKKTFWMSSMSSSLQEVVENKY
jgi:hypothetical protein